MSGVSEQLHPGVYVEEIPIGPHAIDGVTTSTAGFVGQAASGPLTEAVKLTSFSDFESVFGGLQPQGELGYAVRLFFDNGGRVAWVVRAKSQHHAPDPLAALDSTDALNLLCLPGWAEDEVLAAALAYCDRRRTFLVADPPSTDPRSATGVAERLRDTGSTNAAVYFPSVTVVDPVSGGPRSCAPSGAVAGLIARTDVDRGVWHAPAGVGARLVGVTGVDAQVSEQDAESLAAAGVNTIRSVSNVGVVVWGSRTVAPDGDWKYVSVRRTALFIEESLSRGLQWAVFEPNDEPLWVQVRQSVAGFLMGLWRSGGLQGQTADEAFFVKCNRDVMTQNDLDNGRLVALVGFAAVKAAEFLLLRIVVQASQA